MFSLAAFTLIACTSLSAVDGDTIKCDGRNMRLLGNGAPFVDGVDAPEIRRARCEREKQLGRKARQRLSDLIAGSGVSIEYSGEIDSFERPLVRVRLGDGRTAGQVLIEEGLAVVWMPGKDWDWCRP